MKILLVEDNIINRLQLQALLGIVVKETTPNPTIIAIDSLGEAKNQYASSDLVIFDLTLTDSDPYTTIEFITSILKEKPICIYTCETDERIMETLSSMGIGVIKKGKMDKDQISQEIYKTEVNFEKNKMTGFFDQVKDKLLELKDILKPNNAGNT